MGGVPKLPTFLTFFGVDFHYPAYGFGGGEGSSKNAVFIDFDSGKKLVPRGGGNGPSTGGAVFILSVH